MLSTKEVKELYGLSLSTVKLYSEEGLIDKIKLGNKIFFSASDLEKLKTRNENYLPDDQIWVEITPSTSEVRRLIRLGYPCFGKNKLKVAIKHLTKSSWYKLDVVCARCGKITTQAYASVVKSLLAKHGKYLCFSCAHSFTDDEIYKIYESKNCTLLTDIRDYRDYNSLLTYKCNTHNTIFSTSLRYFKRNKFNCPLCYKESITNSNCRLYKDGTTKVKKLFRKAVNSWRLDSLKAANYRCDISNTAARTLEVHHLVKSFDAIFYEVFAELGIPIKINIEDYTIIELFTIEKAIKEKHYHYGLGVVLTKELHQKLHAIYSTKFNIGEQEYIEFKTSILKKEKTLGI